MKLEKAITKDRYNPQPPFNIVSYFGLHIMLEERFKYIATDGGGTVVAFAEKPGFTEKTWSCKGEEQVLMYLNNDIDNWKKTCAEIRITNNS